MSYREYRGNIFASRAQVLVNTVNCVGVMGKGVALEFRRRFPEMYADYRRVCEQGRLRPGQILPYRKSAPWILNFAVKDDWRHPSRMEWVESCLSKFTENYRVLGIKSVAMPWIGAMNGRLPWPEVHAMMVSYLSDLPDLDIEVVEFDPNAPDPLFERLHAVAEQFDAAEFAERASLSELTAATIMAAVKAGIARSLSDVLALDRLGSTSVDHLYQFLVQGPAVGAAVPAQPRLL
jgi:O-acetyl-ADP-ribose deacetylase (regulator of RNase III)